MYSNHFGPVHAYLIKKKEHNSLFNTTIIFRLKESEDYLYENISEIPDLQQQKNTRHIIREESEREDDFSDDDLSSAEKNQKAERKLAVFHIEPASDDEFAGGGEDGVVGDSCDNLDRQEEDDNGDTFPGSSNQSISGKSLMLKINI